MSRYVAAAVALGIGWFVVLLLPSMTRGWLLEDPGRNGTLLVVSSVIVAIAFRRFITRADDMRGHLVRAAILPYVGCVVYISLVAGPIWLEQLAFGGLANLHDTISLYVMGLTAAVLACVVVVPYGLFCQYVMAAAAERIR